MPAPSDVARPDRSSSSSWRERGSRSASRFTGFVIGAAIGIGLAVLMARYKVVERGLLPYLVISQTVPLIALAPLVVSWGGKLHIGGFEWPRWLSAAVLGAFLAFFPVAVGTLKGLTSAPQAASLELMDSYAASWRQTLVQAPVPGGDAVHDPGTEARGDRVRDRGGGRGDIDRARGRRGEAHHRVRTRGDERPGEGVHGRVRGRRTRTGDGRARGADRPGDDAEPSPAEVLE